jgi:hypothetical protein
VLAPKASLGQQLARISARRRSLKTSTMFRALTLFGRRPTGRVDGLGIPASDLHKTELASDSAMPCQ